MSKVLLYAGAALLIGVALLLAVAASRPDEFRLVPQPDGSTEVVWSRHGPNNFIGKVMGVLINMDKMVGQDFEDGLAYLQTLSQTLAKETP